LLRFLDLCHSFNVAFVKPPPPPTSPHRTHLALLLPAVWGTSVRYVPSKNRGNVQRAVAKAATVNCRLEALGLYKQPRKGF